MKRTPPLSVFRTLKGKKAKTLMTLKTPVMATESSHRAVAHAAVTNLLFLYLHPNESLQSKSYAFVLVVEEGHPDMYCEESPSQLSRHYCLCFMEQLNAFSLSNISVCLLIISFMSTIITSFSTPSIPSMLSKLPTWPLILYYNMYVYNL